MSGATAADGGPPLTVKLDLNPEVEARIAAQAAARGLPLDAYVQSLVEEAARLGPPGAATIALLDAWDAEDATDDPAELEQRRREFDQFKTAMNANRPGQRAIFP